MNERIRDLAITGGIYDCICDPYDKLENGDYYSSVMVDLERFAHKIVKECADRLIKEATNNCDEDTETYYALIREAKLMKQYYGVEE
jgi:hypothetical protein